LIPNLIENILEQAQPFALTSFDQTREATYR
jgi:hypothetical protein